MDGTPQNGPEDQDQGETYSPIEAGRVLGVSGERIRQLIDAGDLSGEKRAGRWHVFRVSVHHQLERRGSPRARRSRERAPHSGEDAAREAQELQARVEELSYKLGRSEARAELTEEAESTMREERERLIADLERERERAERLERELQEARRGFWSRLFGS
jgi:predicted RNase H-like nuclease (RuvC/YqgF family)